MAVDIATQTRLEDWIGQRDTVDDIVTPWVATALDVVLGRKPDAYAASWNLRPGGQWLAAQPQTPAELIGEDGHEARGHFLPPVPLPRRMWAAGEVHFRSPLKIGEPLRRVSRVAKIVEKTGRTGPLVFVTVEHQYLRAANLAIRETQEIVYRAAPAPGSKPPAPPAAPGNAGFSRTIHPDAVMLFRYSALTFNGHLIHYDRDHCRENGYPGLVVHGPLIATLLIDLASRDAGMKVSWFKFRAISPLFEGAPFTVNARWEGGRLKLWAANADGGLAMEAEAEGL